jgi:SAM-dependent methyltransferase
VSFIYDIIWVIMMPDYKEIHSIISRYSERPPFFEPGEPLFWDDPHISRGMLEAHLNPVNDLSSRRPVTIDKEVNHLLSSRVLKPGDRVLDLGCGPGLYASRLAKNGLKVTGIDISARSLNYAIAHILIEWLYIYYCLSISSISYIPDDKLHALVYYNCQ